MELYHHGVKKMKWGVRRYQNEDGTLTEEGKKRYARARKENARKKKENRVSEDVLNDPNEWVREDISNTRDVVKGAQEVVNIGKDIERMSRPKPRAYKADTSSMNDTELRNRINRLMMEKQYSDLTRQPEKVSKGRAITQDILEYSGAILGIAASGLGIALAVKKLNAY